MASIMNDTKPYRLEPVSMGDVAGADDLIKALELAERLEDEEIVRKPERALCPDNQSEFRQEEVRE